MDDEVRPNASSSTDPRPPGLETQLGAGQDTMPRERPAIETQYMERSYAAEGELGSYEELITLSEKLCLTVEITSQTLSYVSGSNSTPNIQLASAGRCA